MSLVQTFILALKNILSSKIRAFLTMLGIIIGVSGVMVIIGMGNGMENYMKDSFQSLGTDLLTVTIIGTGSSEKVTPDDMYELVSENKDYLKDISPVVNVQGTVKIGSETLDQTGITGVSESYGSMRKLELKDGRFLQYDRRDGPRRCLRRWQLYYEHVARRRCRGQDHPHQRAQLYDYRRVNRRIRKRGGRQRRRCVHPVFYGLTDNVHGDD